MPQGKDFQTSRRQFLGGTLAAATAISVAKQTSLLKGAETVKQKEPLSCLDYAYSFICCPKSFNSVRFWIESRTILIDEKSNKQTVIYQCASCKSENTFGKSDLFLSPNYDFMPIFGGEDLLIFRRHAHATDRYRELVKAESVWGDPILKLRQAKGVSEISKFEEIRDATAAAIPLVAQTEIHNEETGLRAILEYPVKTMNIDRDNNIYQVDTGPLALPDLTRREDSPLGTVSLAFVAFNQPHFADFVIEQLTPIKEDDAEITKVYHYSNPISLTARNRILTVPVPAE